MIKWRVCKLERQDKICVHTITKYFELIIFEYFVIKVTKRIGGIHIK